MPENPGKIVDTGELVGILEAVGQVNAVRDTGILSPEQRDHPLFKCAFTEVIIYIRDLLAKCERRGCRIAFTDDVDADEECRDVSDLIRLTRDAVCHLDSSKRNTGYGSAAFLVIAGAQTPAKLMGFMVSSAFPDDARVYYGSRGLYLRRHLFRAYDEAVKALRASDPIINGTIQFFAARKPSGKGVNDRMIEFIRTYPQEIVISGENAQKFLESLSASGASGT